MLCDIVILSFQKTPHFFMLSLYQHYYLVDPEMAREIIRFSPVAWQHINFIGKYEFYNRGDIINIQEVIENIIDDFKNDISAVSQ